MGPIQSFDDLLGLLSRRRVLITSVAALGILAALAYGRAQPSLFETAAVIQVETPVIADETGVIGPSRAAQSLQLIQQRLTTRENLIAMIERHGLYADQPGLSIDQKVAALRASIRTESVASASQQVMGSGASVSALIINASALQPEQAARIANDLAQGVLDLGSAGRAARSRETTRFFLEEESQVSRQIAALEDRIADFKNRNSDSLPAANESRRDEITELDAEIRTLDQQLVGLAGETAVLENNRARRSLEERQLESARARQTVIEAQKAALQTRRAEVEAAIARTPAIERELSAFDRELQQLQSQYEVVTTRLAEARTTQRLEERDQSERFSLLERAIIPDAPSSSRATKITVLGVVASLGLAFGLAFLLDLMHPVLRTQAQMERALDLRPVVTIPELRRPRRPLLPRPSFLGAGVVLAVAALAAGALAG